MSPTEEYTLALSYASEDDAIAGAIATRLRRDGLHSFYSRDRVHRLLNLPLPTVLTAVYGCPHTVVVLIVSSTYWTKPWPRREYEISIGRCPNDRMIVVRVDDTPLPSELAERVYADVPRDGVHAVAAQVSTALVERFNVTASLTELRPQARLSDVSDIAFLDNPDEPYTLERVTFVDAESEDTVDVFSNVLERSDPDAYVTRGASGTEIGVTAQDVLGAKADTVSLIEEKRRSGWPIFNGRKYGVSLIRRSRTTEAEDHLLNVVLYETDYYSSLFSKHLHKRLRRRGLIEPDYSQGLSRYSGLMRSFGFNILLIAPFKGFPHLLLTRRSPNVANARDTAGMLHVSMNEGLSLSDRCNREFSASSTVFRGFHEELGLRRSDIVRVDLFEPFMEVRNFEPALIGVAYTQLDLEGVIERATLASDRLLENAGFVPIPATVDAVTRLLASDMPRTNILDFSLRSALDRAIFS